MRLLKRITTGLLVAILLLTNSMPAFASFRFGLDNQNTRKIQDTGATTDFPFQEVWTADLGGQVESQPIIANGFIYAQAGKYLVKVSMDGKTVEKTPYVVNNHEQASGSSPTFANTIHGPRIYQATRDHRLWAIDPDTLQPLWDYGPQRGNALLISAGGQPDKRYRITSSPLVMNFPGRNPMIALGTGHGDNTNAPNQYADNGFFIIEDTGSQGKYNYFDRMEGEVTGSPIFHNGLVIATQNKWLAKSSIIRYNALEKRILKNTRQTDKGQPGSPVADGDYIYVADQVGNVYKYRNKSESDFTMVWRNNAPSNSYNLNTPTVGTKYIFLPIRHYRTSGTAGPGAVVAIDKETGKTAWVKQFGSALKSNVLYWQPSALAKKGYIFVFEAQGLAWVLDEDTGQPINWFLDKATGQVKQTAELAGKIGKDEQTSEIIIHDRMLLIVDGKGVMHAYQAQKAVNFVMHSAQVVEDKEYEVGDTVTFKFEVQNMSGNDYDNVPVVLFHNGKLVAETMVNLKKYGTEGDRAIASLSYKMEPPALPNFQVYLNPPGHAKEVKIEKYKDDNYKNLTVKVVSRDLAVTSLKVPNSLDTNTSGTITTVFRNDSNRASNNVLVRWSQDDKVIKEMRINIGAGQTNTQSFAWKAPSTPGIVNIKAEIDPTGEFYDIDRSNNIKNAPVRVGSNEARSCDKQKPTGTWTVTYPLITSHTVTPTTHDDHWGTRTVTYTESLSGTVEVNTKQGIPTDPNNPKPGDRESRGSWQIIPDTKKPGTPIYGKNPNHVTRAGYGFEVKVTTEYTNDWETKVPVGLHGTAKPYGGSYNGPTRVWAEFFDTRGRYVGKIDLERTGGTTGKGKATWELPAQQYRFPDGQVVSERKHYTSVDIPDGNYKVLVHIEGAGVNNLYICKEFNVYIYGSMYDDQYTGPNPKLN